jgi:hypothetical protein
LMLSIRSHIAAVYLPWPTYRIAKRSNRLLMRPYLKCTWLINIGMSYWKDERIVALYVGHESPIKGLSLQEGLKSTTWYGMGRGAPK